MFTGIIETVGKVTSVEDAEDRLRLGIDAGSLAELPLGASIAVDGVCLTAVAVTGTVIAVDVVAETTARSTLGRLRPGDQVNLERPVAVDGRFDGHLVQGHVDGTGLVTEVRHGATGVLMSVEAPESLTRYIVEKGSIAVDGVSLTVAATEGPVFIVALIPHTLEMTTLGLRRPGDRVNLEVDVLAKYVERLLGSRR